MRTCCGEHGKWGRVNKMGGLGQLSGESGLHALVTSKQTGVAE